MGIISSNQGFSPESYFIRVSGAACILGYSNTRITILNKRLGINNHYYSG